MVFVLCITRNSNQHFSGAEVVDFLHRDPSKVNSDDAFPIRKKAFPADGHHGVVLSIVWAHCTNCTSFHVREAGHGFSNDSAAICEQHNVAIFVVALRSNHFDYIVVLGDDLFDRNTCQCNLNHRFPTAKHTFALQGHACSVRSNIWFGDRYSPNFE